jgi:hypothetical protein
MKPIDTKEGRIFGVNLIDLIVVIVVAFLLFNFGSKVLMEDLTYSGDEMYNAIQAYQRLDMKGFLVETDIEGKWIADEKEFSGKGVITETRSGAFAVKTTAGETLWIGGSMGYLEDIATSELHFRPLDNYVTTLYLEPRSFSNYKEMLDYFKDIKQEYRADHLLVSMDHVTFLNPNGSAQKIFNDFDGLYWLKYVGIVQTSDREATFRIKLVELSELEKIDIASDSIETGKIEVHPGYITNPNLGGGVHVASIEDLK